MQTWTGGARIDLQNATFPFAKLSVDKGELTLRIAQVIYRFRNDQVRAIEVVRAVPIIGRGIRIHHDVVGYPQLIVFWTMSDPNSLSAQLRAYGFGSNPQGTYEKTDFRAERSTFMVIGILFVVLSMMLLSGFCIVAAIFSFLAGKFRI
jgi:hypothetical protein